MALIKGSKANQAGVVVVQGDQVIAADAVTASGVRVRQKREQPAVSTSANVAMGPVAEKIEKIAPQPSPDAVPEEKAAASHELLAGWDTVRDAQLQAAQANIVELVEAVVSENVDPVSKYEQLVEETSDRLAETLGPASIQMTAAIDVLAPNLERQAVALAEVQATAVVARVSWQEFATAEEQIAAILANFELPADANSIAKLLAEREQILAEARLSAELILAEANKSAAEAKAAVENEITRLFEEFEATRTERFEQLREKAQAEGYIEGRSQADEEGARIIEEAIETLNRARLSLPQAVRENAEKLVQLALGVAEKLIQDEIAAKPEIVLRMLDAALDKVTDMETVIVRVNPKDLPLVQAQEDKYRDRLAQVKKLEFAASPKIQCGGVFIETNSGTVDATIKTQLSVLGEVFGNIGRELEGAGNTANETAETFDQ
ncbi:MAG: hypothetical protein HY692_00290 [Cyanobacteria bacterium NC_groundwater_1444_Ag_S-0.65um_54_12]|nr:hypothetical protein [Cyanobacteria bacterium NC_groundwater_1444_Ag_S-0.65um_54_12]